MLDKFATFYEALSKRLSLVGIFSGRMLLAAVHTRPDTLPEAVLEVDRGTPLEKDFHRIVRSAEGCSAKGRVSVDTLGLVNDRSQVEARSGLRFYARLEIFKQSVVAVFGKDGDCKNHHSLHVGLMSSRNCPELAQKDAHVFVRQFVPHALDLGSNLWEIAASLTTVSRLPAARAVLVLSRLPD